MFGLPNDTLRYYESRGIITPHRDEESGYRYYDSWDMNYLLDSVWYRGYDFSLHDVEEMINKDGLDTFTSRCRKRELELLATISEYQHKLKQLAKYRKKLERIPQELGQFTLEDSPAMIWQRERTKGVLEKGKGADIVRQWVERMPYVDHTFVMPEIKPERGEFNEYCWGFSLPPEEMERLRFDIPDTAEYIPSFKSVRTVFWAGGEGTFMDCFNAQVIAPVKEKGHLPTHPPVGHLLVRIHENGEMRRFFEVWVPIE
jgi:DNA-binding transcriptional MerR regulator